MFDYFFPPLCLLKFALADSDSIKLEASLPKPILNRPSLSSFCQRLMIESSHDSLHSLRRFDYFEIAV